METLKKKGYIFASIFTLSNRLQVIGDKFDKDLTVKQWLLLAGILNSGKKAPTLTEVAAIIGSSRQNVKKMAVALEKAGFVNLEKDENDARILRINPTDMCWEHIKKREKREIEFLERLFTGFDIQTLDGLCKGISELERNIAEMGDGNDYEEKD
ncbi:MAG TPA: MarR family transcriptional regulator [Bacillota bacterium]|nr:MAG: transcriptional repressor MprA [Firmicutes bacterium ADurb.Bin153]HNV34826.1 MarR family transcriptional regulator [Bacillota bacterium]